MSARSPATRIARDGLAPETAGAPPTALDAFGAPFDRGRPPAGACGTRQAVDATLDTDRLRTGHPGGTPRSAARHPGLAARRRG